MRTNARKFRLALTALMLAALLLAVFGAVPARAAGPVCTVHPTDPGADYATIQAAVNDAGCTTINVAAGTYPEVVNINKSLQLLGAKAGIPAGPDANPANRGVPGEESIINGRVTIAGGGSNATVDGFTINSGGQHGIKLSGGDTVKNNIIDGGPGNTANSGIWSGGGGGNIVSNNNIRNYQRGMLFDGGVTDPQCTISGNYITNASLVGIHTMGSWSNGHVFSDNLIENNASGMVLAQGEHQVSGNTIRNNSGSGIYIWATARTFGIQITQNTIEGNVTGIKLGQDHVGAVNNVAHCNNIVGNTHGVINDHSAEFDAEDNWWGAADGPNDPQDEAGENTEVPPCDTVTGAAMMNVDGAGDNVQGPVDYCPWYDALLEDSTSVNTTTGTGQATFTPSVGFIRNLEAVAEATLPAAGKPDRLFAHGFFSFDICCLTPCQHETVVVTIVLPENVPVGTTYWKYHASEGGWIQIPMGSDDGDNVITITLQDGGLGDDDGECNGVIVDQGGPGQLIIYTLTVHKIETAGASGRVTSEPAGINCGVDCTEDTEDYVKDTVVTLTAHPGVKSYFVEWGGACSGTERTVQVTMDADKTCTATFGYPIGGIVVPVDKLGLVAPWIGLGGLVSLASLGVVVVRRRRS